MTAPSFQQFGTLPPQSPVVVSVPHAGRDYPAGLRAALRVPLSALTVLEDRHVDALALGARTDEVVLVQRLARAWIDLNRGEDERDPRIDDGATPIAQPMQSAKLRSGLGLVPRRAGAAGDMWRSRLSDAEVRARIDADHRPYHAALDAALDAARARFGIAILLDLHSMPSLGRGAANMVIGDRFGRSAAARFVARMEGEAAAAGLRTALNTPYAGGHVLDAHARPDRGIHAIQLEIDRSLYLDARLDAPGPGLARITAVLRAMLAALADEALAGAQSIAAE